MSAAENIALEERYLSEVWDARNPEAEANFAAPHYRRHITPTEETDLAGQIEREKRFVVAFPDGSIEAHDIVADDDFVVIRATGRGTNLGEWSGYTPSGKTMEASIVLHEAHRGRQVRRAVGRPRPAGDGTTTRHHAVQARLSG